MITNDVYNVLKSRTEETRKTLAEINAIEEEIAGDKWNMHTVNAELYPKRSELRSKLHRQIESAGQEARQLVKKYQDELRAADNLDPSALNDDVRLLNCGVNLDKRDIMAMLERNKGNPTMTQLAMRYAREHQLEVPTYFYGHEQEIKDAENVNIAIDLYCSHWMDKDNASEILDKFFCA